MKRAATRLPIAILVSSAALALTSACNRNTNPEPSEDRLAKAFTSKNSPIGISLSPKQAKCVAEAYTDSGLSANYLNTLARGKQPLRVSRSDREALDDLTAKLAKDCLAL